MDELTVLMTFTGGLAAALALGYFAHRVGLSPIVGYLLAGIVIGPFTPGFVGDRAVAEQFAEIGVILLLFGIGLRFDFAELFSVWRVAVPGALAQSVLSTLLLAGLLSLLGWEWRAGLVLGMAVSVASTVVMAKVLGEHRDLHAPVGRVAIGWTVVEDLLTVAVLIVLPISALSGGGGGASMGGELGLAGLKVAVLLALVLALGRWVFPWALELVARTRSRELFTLAVLAMALVMAVGAARLFGVSMALGAFLAGMAVGRSEFAARAAGDAVPMRDAFAVLFFVSVGMLFDPASLVAGPLLVLAVLAVVVLGKPLAAFLVLRVLGTPLPQAIAIGAAFSQIGEFSFVLGSLAKELGLLDGAGWNALVAASIVSIAANPAIYGAARSLASRAGRGRARTHAGQSAVIAASPGAAAEPRTGTAPSPEPAGGRSAGRTAISGRPERCIIVGYGPVGRVVHRLLEGRGVETAVVDLNLHTVRGLKASGCRAVYGDAARPDTLIEAGIDSVDFLVLSADVEDAAETVRAAKALNPSLRVYARCAHLRDAEAIRMAGADLVAAGEAEVGVALVEAMSRSAGTDGVGIEEGREEWRRRLYGPGA